MKTFHKQSLFSLYLAYFADYFCWGATVAFLAVYISSTSTPFHNLYWDPQIALGVAFAAFPIGEVIGSPILGDLSDWIGRKKVLIWGFWGSIASMALCAFSLKIGNYFLFLSGQLLVGFFAGKQAMAQAAIVEIQAGTKGQKLAFLSVLGGVAWIIGPLLGGQLLEKPFTSHGGYIWPNIMAIGIYLVSLLCTHLFFKDPYLPSTRNMSPLTFLKSVGEIFILSWKEKLFFIFLLNLLGWYLLVVSLSEFLLTRFQLSSAQIGLFNSYLPLCFTIGGIIGTAWILHRWKAKNILFWSLLIGSFGLFLLFEAKRIVELWTYLAIPALTEAWIYPAYQTALSDHTSDKNQGKLFGLIGASNGICQFVASMILGGISGQFSILVAALLFIASGVLLPSMIRKKRTS